MFEVDARLNSLEWYGYGPQECYVDRMGGSRLGRYRADVKDQLTPYLRPQEAGSHVGVRWANVTDNAGHGLRFECLEGMEFSALAHSPDEIENALHHYELPPIFRTVIRPAMMRRGVGGDDSWGAMTHDEFRIPKGRAKFQFAFRGV